MKNDETTYIIDLLSQALTPPAYAAKIKTIYIFAIAIQGDTIAKSEFPECETIHHIFWANIR